MVGKLLSSRSGIFLAGFATAGLLKNAGPAIGVALRPVARESIRFGMNASRKLTEAVETAREELEDIVAEVREAEAEAEAEAETEALN